MTSAPIVFHWDGSTMRPQARFAAHCRATFQRDQFYTMEVQALRRESSHRHYFAALNEAWANLPEKFDGESWAQSREHMRHFALISCGWCNTKVIVCATNAEAVRWAAIVRPMQPFSIVTAVRSTVVDSAAVSQSRAAMGAKDFLKSKWEVLDFVADLVGTTRGELEAAAEKSVQ